MINVVRMIVPIRCKFEENKSLINTADNSAHPVGFSVLIILFTYEFVLNLSIILETIVTKISEGSTIEIVAIKEPNTPDVENPAKVAMLIPTGPGVIDETASILVNCEKVYQWNFSAISYKNGSVAYPPPKENKPI